MLLPHLASRLYGTPLLLARSKLDIILSVLGSRVGWSEPPLHLALPQVRAAPMGTNSNLNSNLNPNPAGIAVIPVHGSLVRRALGLDAQSGLMSYDEIRVMLDAAVADPGVNGILLDIDSQGGEAGGVFELARHIRTIDAVKPVWAIACDATYSAAYAIAASASRVFLTQTAGLGSIGVIAMHVDQSAHDAQQGYRFTAVSAGERKNDLSPHEPLSRSAMGVLQAEVDRLYGLFCDHVADMRSMPVSVVKDTQAGLFFGPDAVNAGLADAVSSFDQVIADFSIHLAQQRIRQSATRVMATSVEAFAEPPLLDVAPTGCDPPQEATRATANRPASTPTPTQQFPTPTTPLIPNQKEIAMNQRTQVLELQLQAPKPSDAPADGENLVPGDAPQTLAAPEPAAVDASVADALAEPVSPPSHASTPAPTPAPYAGAAAQHERSEAIEIAELCTLVGQSARIAAFLSQGASADQVRQALLAARAQGVEISSLLRADAAGSSAGSPAGSVPGNPTLMAAVRKLSQPQ